MANQFSSLCISLLTELLDLTSLEGLLDEQRESFVLKNIRSELGKTAEIETDIDIDSNNSECGEKKEKKFHIRLIKPNSKGMETVFENLESYAQKFHKRCTSLCLVLFTVICINQKAYTKFR